MTAQQKPVVTVFIGTYNRLETLERTVASYRHLTTPHELVIIDNGTDDHQCIELLDRLEKEVKRIFRLPGCVSMEEATENFNHGLRALYENGEGGKWFAVTEADVCFDGTHRGALDAYVRLARKTGYSVGPHLRVDADIPKNYPLRSRVLACETWMLYARDHHYLGKIPYVPCQIDTTFHLFPRTRHFDRLRMDPIRVGPPYDAMHLDWYLDITRPTKENRILIPDERPMGSWAKAWIRDFWTWFQDSPELAFERLLAEPRNPSDLCNNAFMLAWCYQYGHGCEQNAEEAWNWIEAAIPLQWSRYWENAEDWRRMIFENDVSALGWSA